MSNMYFQTPNNFTSFYVLLSMFLIYLFQTEKYYTYVLRNAISKDFDPIVLKPNYGLYRLSQETCDKKYKLMHYEVNLDTTS